MITGEYILDVVIFDEDTGEDVWEGNIFMSNVSVETSIEFCNLVRATAKKEHGDNVSVRIMGVFKL